MSSIPTTRSDLPQGRIPSLVVLIDGDNASSKIVNGLLSEIANYGVAVVRRVYGDWTKPNLAGWKSCLLDHSIQPIQQFAYTTGKNSTDSSLIIDAMDLLHSGRFDGFCIVSSDSDFTRLASRIREQGLTVYGFGEKRTPKPFVSACDKFIYVDVLREPKSQSQPQEQERSHPSSSSRRRRGGKGGRAVERTSERAPVADRVATRRIELSEEVASAIRTAVAARADEDGWARHDTIGNHISRIVPSFDPRNYGVSKLIEVLSGSGLVETKRSESGRFWLVRLASQPVLAHEEEETRVPAVVEPSEIGTAEEGAAASASETRSVPAPADDASVSEALPAPKKPRRSKRAAGTTLETAPVPVSAEAESFETPASEPSDEPKPKKKARPRKRKD